MAALPQSNPSSVDQKPTMVSLDSVRTHLGICWVSGALLIFFLIIALWMAGNYGDGVRKIFDWLLPNILPTTTLITSVWVSSGLNTEPSTSRVRVSFYFTALTLSIVYLLFIALMIICQTALHPYVDEQVAALQMSNIFVGPIQGIVAAFLGVLFAKKAT